MAKVKYFDFDKNLWVEKKPSKELLLSPSKGAKWIISNTDFTNCDLGMDRLNDIFCDFLVHTGPQAALLHCSNAALSRIKSNKSVRKSYALIEPRNQGDELTVVFVQSNIPVDVQEAKDVKGLRTLMYFTLGGGPSSATAAKSASSSASSSLSMIVAGSEPGAHSVFSRANNEVLFPSLLRIPQHQDADISVLASNLLHAGSSSSHHHSRDPLREACKAANYVDTDGQESGAWAIMLRSSRYDFEAQQAGRRTEPRSTVVVLTPTARGNTGSIDIPMPRSAKTTGKGVGTPVLTDPAVLSAEVSKSGSSEILQLLSKKSRWKVDQSFVLKGPEHKLNAQEALFDLSRFFASPNDAVDHLNANYKTWPLDYCVVHQHVLYSENAAPADRLSFRRYAKENFKAVPTYVSAASPASATPGHAANGWGARNVSNSSLPPSVVTPNDYAVIAQVLRQRTMEASAAGTKSGPREWSESCTIIIYQTTPREMKFNISQLVPLTKDPLRHTILMLNKSPTIAQENNPLYDYQYDYALLQSAEHQGFWLIAAKHVPCDIVACRMAV